MNRHAILWIGIVVGLLGLSVVGSGAILVLSLNDPSFALDPSYTEDDGGWTARRAQEAENARLGWTIDLVLAPAAPAVDTAGGPGGVEVVVELFDRWGKPIRDAAVSVEAVQVARARRVLPANLVHDVDGRYAARIDLRRPGTWEFTVEADRAGEVYVSTERQTVSVRGARP